MKSLGEGRGDIVNSLGEAVHVVHAGTGCFVNIGDCSFVMGPPTIDQTD